MRFTTLSAWLFSGVLSATPTINEFDPDASYGSLKGASRLKIAILVSVILHIAILSSVTSKFPLSQIHGVSAPLEVLLMDSKPAPNPDKTDKKEALPRVTARDIPSQKDNGSRHHARSLPILPKQEEAANIPPNTIAGSAPAVAGGELAPREPETQPLMTADNGSDQSVYPTDPFAAPAPPQTQQNESGIFDTADLVQRGLALARVAARSDGGFETNQKPLKRKFIGSRTRDYRFARYAEDWRLKVERIGNLNYPEAAKREQLYGSLQLTVGIRSDGSLESVEINRPSGKKVLDQAAVRIVKLAGQNGFAPFPPELSRDTDVLHITRTWVFTRADELTSE